MVEIVIGLQKGLPICPKTMVEIVIGLQKGHVIFCPKTMVESLIGSQNNHMTFLHSGPNVLMYSSIVAQLLQYIPL